MTRTGEPAPRPARLPRGAVAAALAAWLATGAIVPAAIPGDPATRITIAFEPSPRAVRLAGSGIAAPIVVDAADTKGVRRAAADLQADIFRVASVRPLLVDQRPAKAADLVLVGTLGKSRLIDALAGDGRLDVRAIRGRWESTLIQVVHRPWAGVDRALVVAGSDQRGTIFGIYTLYRTDGRLALALVGRRARPPPRRRSSRATAARVRNEPAVKYRGLFINDEAPALSGWTREKFGGFNHQFYGHVFELLLRLKANFLWPAMWGNAFYADDPQNPVLAARVRHRHRHVAPRADDAGARRVAALRHGPVELHDERRGASRVLGRRRPPHGGLREHRHARDAGRWRRAHVARGERRAARAHRRRSAPDYRRRSAAAT